MVFENGVKNIQAAAYNGARTVDISIQQTCIVDQISISSPLAGQVQKSREH